MLIVLKNRVINRGWCGVETYCRRYSIPWSVPVFVLKVILSDNIRLHALIFWYKHWIDMNIRVIYSTYREISTLIIMESIILEWLSSTIFNWEFSLISLESDYFFWLSFITTSLLQIQPNCPSRKSHRERRPYDVLENWWNLFCRENHCAKIDMKFFSTPYPLLFL